MAAAFSKIETEAEKFAWSLEAVNKMKDLVTQDILGSGNSPGKDHAEKFRNMGKTAIESFKELSVELNQVKAALKPAEFARAKNKLLADLAGGLGIAQYLTAVQTPAQQLAETYRQLDTYAREANLKTQELTEAKKRAADALMKQSEYYSLYQKAQDSMLSVQQKLNRELQRITDEARQWGWDKDILEKMKVLKIEELLGRQDAAQANERSGKNVDQSRNTALEYGTIAYYEKQNQTGKDLLGETKKVVKSAQSMEAMMKWEQSRTNKGDTLTIIS